MMGQWDVYHEMAVPENLVCHIPSKQPFYREIDDLPMDLGVRFFNA